MSVLIADCPRCTAARMTFDVTSQVYRGTRDNSWDSVFEVFANCRECNKPTTFSIHLTDYNASDAFTTWDKVSQFQGSLNAFFEVAGYVSLKDEQSITPPEHLPDDVLAVFQEGATCLAVGCVNAAATMFRLCVDLVTSPLLPPLVEGVEPNRRTRRDLGLRLPWLFENGLLPKDLQDLATAIKDDGNDGAHRGTLSESDANDILDFTVALLERLITQPKRVELAAARRDERRKPKEAA